MIYVKNLGDQVMIQEVDQQQQQQQQQIQQQQIQQQQASAASLSSSKMTTAGQVKLQFFFKDFVIYKIFDITMERDVKNEGAKKKKGLSKGKEIVCKKNSIHKAKENKSKLNFFDDNDNISRFKTPM